VIVDGRLDSPGTPFSCWRFHVALAPGGLGSLYRLGKDDDRGSCVYSVLFFRLEQPHI
jgi:hypothetical protein